MEKFNYFDKLKGVCVPEAETESERDKERDEISVSPWTASPSVKLLCKARNKFSQDMFLCNGI